MPPTSVESDPQRKHSLNRLRWLAALYLLLISIAVLLANDGRYQHVFAWIRKIPGADKLGHFLLMGGLSFVVNLAFRLRTVTFKGRQWLFGSLVVGTVVTLEEISQIWVPSRSFDLLDLLFDFMGICFFGWLARKLASSRP